MTAVLLPAIDLRNRQVVRLAQGDYSRETVYGTNPLAVALDFVAAGATWIHIVDLDAARGDGPVNRDVIGAIAAAVPDYVRIQTGGGVRTTDDARDLASRGVERVVMGSAAVRSPKLVEEIADIIPVAVGLDHRHGIVATDGWTETSTLTIDDALGMYPSASAFVITDISRDGMLEGPDIDGLASAVASTSTPIVASGGVSNRDDVMRLGQIDGLWGIITGRAVYEGRLSISECLHDLHGGAR